MYETPGQALCLSCRARLAPGVGPSLGDVRSRHPANRWEPWVVGCVTCGGSLFALAALNAPVWAYILPLGVGGSLFSLFLFLSPRAATLYDDGIEVQRWVLPTRALRFEEVTAAFWEFSVKTTIAGTFVADSVVRLEDRAGKSLRLNPKSFKEPELLFARLGRLCIWPGHQRRMEAFRLGDDVSFGKIFVSRTGLRVGSTSHRWEDVKAVDISPVALVIRYRGMKWPTRVRLARIPYAFTLVEIVAACGVALTAQDGFILNR